MASRGIAANYSEKGRKNSVVCEIVDWTPLLNSAGAEKSDLKLSDLLTMWHSWWKKNTWKLEKGASMDWKDAMFMLDVKLYLYIFNLLSVLVNAMGEDKQNLLDKSL